jgi:hypothetical protein
MLLVITNKTVFNVCRLINKSGIKLAYALLLSMAVWHVQAQTTFTVDGTFTVPTGITYSPTLHFVAQPLYFVASF